MLRKASAVCVLCGAAILLLAPFEVAAKSGFGFRGHSFRAGAHFGALRRFPWAVGGVTSSPYYDYSPFLVGDASISAPVAYPPEPPRVLTCHRTQETVTVLSEDSGVREIKITRC